MKNSNKVKKKIKLNDFRKTWSKRIWEGIFWNYQMNYLTEFDVVTIVYMFCAKIFFFF